MVKGQPLMAQVRPGQQLIILSRILAGFSGLLKAQNFHLKSQLKRAFSITFFGAAVCGLCTGCDLVFKIWSVPEYFDVNTYLSFRVDDSIAIFFSVLFALKCLYTLYLY